MGCDQCGDQTPNAKLCSECQRLERAENDARHDRGETDAHECPSCGEDRALVEGKQCWLCRSDRFEEGEDGRPEAVTDGGDQVKTMCPECRVVRWHDPDPKAGTATCRACGHESTPDERNDARNEERLDDLNTVLKDGTGAPQENADLARWSS